ncbi:MAG: hypothetical protein R2708_05020 [Vicinamibacterales bacterium]
MALAALKVVVALAGIPAALNHLPSPAAAVPFAINLVIFGLGGLLMVIGGGRDRRLQLLGGLYLIIAAALRAVRVAAGDGPAGAALDALMRCTPEVFWRSACGCSPGRSWSSLSTDATGRWRRRWSWWPA